MGKNAISEDLISTEPIFCEMQIYKNKLLPLIKNLLY